MEELNLIGFSSLSSLRTNWKICGDYLIFIIVNQVGLIPLNYFSFNVLKSHSIWKWLCLKWNILGSTD